MKISRYTILFKANETGYVYNTLSNALLKVDEEMYDSLEKARADKLEVVESLIINNLILV